MKEDFSILQYPKNYPLIEIFELYVHTRINILGEGRHLFRSYFRR